MYNKYFTMKRSELKEAIKAEIKSVLSEAMSDEERKMMDDLHSAAILDDEDIIEKFNKMSEKELKDYAEFTSKIVDSGYGEGDESQTQTDYFIFLRSLPNFNQNFLPKYFKKLSEKMSPEEMDSKRRQAMRGGAKAEPLAKLATIGQKKKTVTIGDNEQEYKIEKVMANGDILISRDGKNIGTFSPNQLKPVNEIAPMGPGQTTTLADFEEEEEVKVNNSKKIDNPLEELFFHADSYKKGMIDVDDIKQAFEEILRDYKDDIIADRSVTFSDIREDEDEDNKAAEKDAKKEKKFAGKQKEAEDLKTKIEDKKAEMVKKAKEYKAAEGKAKEEIKDQLKKMTAERDELNKQLEKLKRVEI